VKYPLSLVSDSGNSRDLGSVEFSEVIKDQPGATGYAATLVTNTSEDVYDPATAAPPDYNSVSKSVPKTSNGVDISLDVYRPLVAQSIQKKMDKDGPTARSNATSQQYFLFKDSRTAPRGGATPFVIAKSGFELSFSFYKEQGKYFIRVKRTGAANHGAGKGEVSNADGNQPAVEIR
jgi:hypothetical protein